MVYPTNGLSSQKLMSVPARGTVRQNLEWVQSFIESSPGKSPRSSNSLDSVPIPAIAKWPEIVNEYNVATSSLSFSSFPEPVSVKEFRQLFT
jgi:hypothetical protein